MGKENKFLSRVLFLITWTGCSVFISYYKYEESMLLYNYTHLISLIKIMRHWPDGIFKWIGHFMDHWSKFHVLFALSHKTAAEVALDLQISCLVSLPPSLPPSLPLSLSPSLPLSLSPSLPLSLSPSLPLSLSPSPSLPLSLSPSLPLSLSPSLPLSLSPSLPLSLSPSLPLSLSPSLPLSLSPSLPLSLSPSLPLSLSLSLSPSLPPLFVCHAEGQTLSKQELQQWCDDKFEASENGSDEEKQLITQRISFVLERLIQHVGHSTNK